MIFEIFEFWEEFGNRTAAPILCQEKNPICIVCNHIKPIHCKPLTILKQYLTRMCFLLSGIDDVLSFTTKCGYIMYIFGDKQFLLFSLL